jgi:DNA-binding SARP family transcriptional activator
VAYIRLFGPTTAEINGRTISGSELGGVKPRQILEILAVEAGSPVAKDRLADLLWEGQPPTSYMGTLESYVCVLRRDLGLSSGRSSLLATTPNGYRLDTERVSVDLWDFRRLTDEASRSAPAAALAATEKALQLATGELLVGEPYAEWAMRARSYFSHRLVTACVQAAHMAVALGDLPAALRLARTAVDHDPLCEDAVRQLMSAMWATGRRCEALRAYAEMRQLMLDEHGAEPGTESHELYLSILCGGSSAGADDSAANGRELHTLVQLLRQVLDATPMAAAFVRLTLPDLPTEAWAGVA